MIYLVNNFMTFQANILTNLLITYCSNLFSLYVCSYENKFDLLWFELHKTFFIMFLKSSNTALVCTFLRLTKYAVVQYVIVN